MMVDAFALATCSHPLLNTINKRSLTSLGESTLTDAMTAAGKTYEEIALLVAEQVNSDPAGTQCITVFSNLSPIFPNIEGLKRHKIKSFFENYSTMEFAHQDCVV